MTKISYPSIPSDVLIDIQISGGFYHQIVATLMSVAQTKTQEEFKAALESMKEDGPAKDEFHLTIRTLTALVYEIESKAKKQDKLKMNEVEKPIEDQG